MWIDLSETDLKIINDVSKVTGADYNLKADLINTNELMIALEEMVVEYHVLEEKLEDLEQNIKDNYKPIPISEQVGISDNEFI